MSASCTAKLFPTRGNTKIDNCIFQLHYIPTILLLLAGFLLISSKQHLGTPLLCNAKNPQFILSQEELNIHCWTTAAFSVPNKVNFSRHFREQPIDASAVKLSHQWIGSTLLLQALLFYIPRLIWKMAEGGKMKRITLGLEDKNGDKSSNNHKLVEYLFRNLHHHSFYVFIYIVCDMLNIVNVIAQFFLTDLFLGGNFITYGSDIIKFAINDTEIPQSPMLNIFPTNMLCLYQVFGASGEISSTRIKCYLALNIFNSSIYLILWFWYVALAAVSVTRIFYWLPVAFSAKFRLFLFKRRSHGISENSVTIVAHVCTLGDWFLLLLLEQNMHVANYHNLIEATAQKIQTTNEISSCL